MEKTEKNDSYSHILKYTGIFGGVQGLSILIGLVRNKFAALLLGTAGMGLVALFNSTINMVVSATNFGIPTSGVREISEQYDASNEQLSSTILLIRSWCLFAALLGMFVCLFFSPLLDGITFVDRGDHVCHFIFLAPAVGHTAVASLGFLLFMRSLCFSSCLCSYLLSVALSGNCGCACVAVACTDVAFSSLFLSPLSLSGILFCQVLRAWHSCCQVRFGVCCCRAHEFGS